MPPVTKTDLSPNDFRRSFNDKNHFFIGNKEEKEWLFDDALALIGEPNIFISIDKKLFKWKVYCKDMEKCNMR